MRPVGVIRGDRVPDVPPFLLQRPMMVRTPVARIPLWLMAAWWCWKWFASALVLVGFKLWWLTAPVVVLAGLWVRFDWRAPLLAVLVVAVGLAVWWAKHPATFDRWFWWRIVGKWRRWRYRRRWWSAMATAGLVVRFDRHEVLPVLKKVWHRAGTDVLLVRMVTGQVPEDFAASVERFIHTFGVTSARVQPHRKPGRVLITMLRKDPLVNVVDPLPATAAPDFTSLPLGLREDGALYALCLFGTQVLVAGATGAGKGSVIWSFVRALAGGVGSGLVKLWGFDPKGGMELGGGFGLFDQFACEDFEAMADLLEQAVDVARRRAARLRGNTRQHFPTVGEPLMVLVIDELAALTAYLPDRKLKERIRSALSVLLSQGRAVGVHVLAAIQDPRKEVLPFRDLFPTRIGLRLTEPAQVDMVLGDGMRQRGALCDRIPQHLPGVGYVVLDGDPTPVRVRFSYLTDEDIADLAATYAPGQPWVIDGETVAEPAGPVGANAPSSPWPAATGPVYAHPPVWRDAA